MKKNLKKALITTVTILSTLMIQMPAYADVAANETADTWSYKSGDWYLLNTAGQKEYGYHVVNGKEYYLDPDTGKMRTGWLYLNNYWYYFDNSGAMLVNTTTPDGYLVDAYGTWIDNISKEQAENEILRLVNEERVKVGANPLVLDRTLCTVADLRAKEIVTLFSHTRPDGQDCFSLYDAYGLQNEFQGENIAYNQRTTGSVMTAWINSEGHKRNILNKDFNRLGVGIAYQNGHYYWVQCFTS